MVGVNSLIDAFVKPINMTAAYIEQLSEDGSDKIESRALAPVGNLPLFGIYHDRIERDSAPFC